ncbi:hypothetical protein [Streptomyces sp. NPDC052494]|uniref:hypothetical protein n=1 Tax=Streptomyces sp. NPDC052494 TaxID=3365692 RepID=UPI0037D3E35F
MVDPYAGEVVVHTQPTGTGYIAAYTHKYGTGKLPIDLADGRTFTLDLDELPRPDPTRPDPNRRPARADERLPVAGDEPTCPRQMHYVA